MTASTWGPRRPDAPPNAGCAKGRRGSRLQEGRAFTPTPTCGVLKQAGDGLVERGHRAAGSFRPPSVAQSWAQPTTCTCSLHVKECGGSRSWGSPCRRLLWQEQLAHRLWEAPSPWLSKRSLGPGHCLLDCRIVMACCAQYNTIWLCSTQHPHTPGACCNATLCCVATCYTRPFDHQLCHDSPDLFGGPS